MPVPSPERVARAHQADRQAVTKAAADAAAQAWARVEPAQIVDSWMAQLPQLTVVVGGAQLAAAQTADDYLDESADAAGLDPATDLEVDPQAFAAVASDGRGLGSLLMSPAFTVLSALAGGAGLASAVQLGGQHLDTIARTQVADAGRLADGVALAARKEITGYVRQVVGATCSRCIILSGRWYAYNAGFQRHPRCDCVHVPSTREQWRASKTVKTPREIYDSLSAAERQRAGWSLADQRAVEDGSDLMAVTNVKGVTAAGTSRQAGRLLPSDIYRLGGADRDAAIRLLREHGYLRGRVRPADPFKATVRDAATPGKVAERAKLSGGQSADTELVTLTDGRKVVHKRASDWGMIADPDVRADIIASADAEELASLLGQAIGAPVARVARANAEAVWVEYIADARIGVDGFYDSPGGIRLGLLDVLTANADRNGGNWLVVDGRLVGIDHGSGWLAQRLGDTPDEAARYAVNSPFGRAFVASGTSDTALWRAGGPLTRIELEEVRRRMLGLRGDFDRTGRGDWLDWSLQILDRLVSHARP